MTLIMDYYMLFIIIKNNLMVLNNNVLLNHTLVPIATQVVQKKRLLHLLMGTECPYICIMTQ